MQNDQVVIRMVMAESCLRVLEEILAINKGHCIQRALFLHTVPQNEKPRRGPVTA